MRVRCRHQHVDGRHYEQCECCTNDHSAHQHNANAVARPRSRAGGEYQRKVTHDRGRSRHQDRSQPRFSRSDNRCQLVLSCLLKMVGKLHDQDAVLRNQADESDQTYLAVYVERRQPQERKHQCTRDGQRHRAHQNDEWIAEAFELRGEDEVDQYRRQQERAEELAALHPKLARLARVVHSEALRQDSLGLVLQETQRFVERHIWRNHSLDGHSVELLEFFQLARLGCGLQRCEGRQRNEFIVGSLYVDLLELIGCQTLRSLDLRNHLVTPALDAKAIYIIPAQHGRKILTGLSQVHSLRAELVAVEDDLGLRLVELQVGVGEDEQTTRECLTHELFSKCVELPGLHRRGNHELNREVSATWQRRRGQWDDADARDF